MVNSLKRLKKFQIIGVILQIISFIGCYLNIDAFTYWFWIGTGLNLMGTIYFIDIWSKEGKTRFRKLDNKRDKNLTRKSSELIFFLTIVESMFISIVFIAEFWIKDFSKQFSTILSVFIMSLVVLIVILIVVEKTFKQVDMIATHNDKIK